MKTLITIASILLVANTAFAGWGPPPFGDDDGGSSEATARAHAESDATAIQGQAQGQVAKTGNNSVSVSANTNYRLPASSAADLMLANCQKGASGQAFGGGASIGSTDEVCLLFSLYALREARGEQAEADQILEEITDIMKIRTNPVRRAFQALPLIGNLF